MTDVVGIVSGTRVGGYRVDELIGRGGMGQVYRAFDDRLERNVALKILAPGLAEDPSFRERLLRVATRREPRPPQRDSGVRRRRG